MQFFPIFVDTQNQRIAVAGGGAAALAKLRLLLKTQAQIEVYAKEIMPEIADFAIAGRLTHIARDFREGDAKGAKLVYGAAEDGDADLRVAAIAKSEGVLFNVVDDLHNSAFITPAIVDRDPVTVAIGTEGAAPVVARAIKRDLEENLPTSLGVLAGLAKGMRHVADTIRPGRMRRDFWNSFFFAEGPRAYSKGGDAHTRATLKSLAKDFEKKTQIGHVDLAGAGPGDPELLTLKTRAALDAADVVVHHKSISKGILELVRREATVIEAPVGVSDRTLATDPTLDTILSHAASGAHVVMLMPGNHDFEKEIRALGGTDISHARLPGIAIATPAPLVRDPFDTITAHAFPAPGNQSQGKAA